VTVDSRIHIFSFLFSPQYSVGTRPPPPGVKPSRREFDFSPFSAEVKMSRAMPFLPCISSRCRQGQLYLLLFHVVRRLSKVTELVYLQFM
jgi:hypothetical protein